MKKKTGHQTPEYRRPTAPPQPTIPPMPQVTKSKQPNKDCTYSTPCGWCTKWDKKCDKKIPKQVGKPRLNALDYTIRTTTRRGKCYKCVNDGYDMPECKDCNPENDFKYFESKEK